MQALIAIVEAAEREYAVANRRIITLSDEEIEQVTTEEIEDRRH